MRAFACACAVLVAAAAWAQVELVDPDAPTVRAKKVVPKKQPTATTDDSVDETTDTNDETVEPDEVTTKKKAAPSLKDAVVAPGPSRLNQELKKDPSVPLPPPLVVTPMSDAQLDQAWTTWREASTSTDVKREQDARQALLKLKKKIGATNLEAWASGLLRISEAKEAAGDSGAAVEMAVTAAELAPELPSAWTGLAEAYFSADPSEIGRYTGALKTALMLQLRDPRYARPMLADIATTFLLALVGTAIAVLLVLLLKRGFYFLYDFHFLFPRAAARWQTNALAVILLIMPIVFRFGVVPSLLALFAAVTLYLSMAERVVAAVLIGLLGFIPLAGGWVTRATAFAGTRAEELYILERGGSGTEALASELSTLAAEDKASFAELTVLGRYELRRGRIEASIEHLKKALTIRPTDISARVNLGVALMINGDLENPKALFTNAKTDAPTLAAAPYNLARLYQRRLATFGERAAGEADSATGELFEAHRRDPSISVTTDEPKPGDGPIEGNEVLMTVPLPNSELMALATLGDAPKRVTSQLSQMILGDAPEGIAPFYPGLLAALVLGLGFLATPLRAAKVCSKCGRPVSRRGDPDVSPGSLMCTQCVNVFAKKNVVATSQKVRKQLEVARYQSRMERIGTVLGLLFSGMGHVFAGWPVRGTVYGFIFLVALLGFILRHGLLRAPYEPLPMVVRVAPVVLVFVLVYLMSLRELRKRQG